MGDIHSSDQHIVHAFAGSRLDGPWRICAVYITLLLSLYQKTLTHDKCICTQALAQHCRGEGIAVDRQMGGGGREEAKAFPATKFPTEEWEGKTNKKGNGEFPLCMYVEQ